MAEKVSFKNSRNLNLVGSLWSADSDAIIIMAHGSDGNRLAKGLFEKIAPALQQERYNVLTFDFSGHGESDDDLFTLEKSVDDLHAALKYAQKRGYKKFALFGHSFGALTCLKAAPKVETMVLLGSMSGAVHWKWEDFYAGNELQKIYDRGYASTPVNDGLRQEVKSDIRILKELDELDEKSMYAQITCPVLMIHGNGDPFEQGFLELSQKALPYLPAGSQIALIEGAQHAFLEHADEVIALAKSWYRRNVYDK